MRSSTAPLVNAASGEARKSTAAATSSGRRDAAERALGAAGVAARADSSSAAMSVSVNPGATETTEMPCPPSARASDWPNAISPALLAP